MPELRLVHTPPRSMRDATFAVLDEWREGDPLAPVLVVASSSTAARLLVRDHAAARGGTSACVQPLTLHDLARAMAGPGDRRPLPRFADRALIAELLADDPGPLGERADRPRVAAAVARTVRDLRLAGRHFDAGEMGAFLERSEYESLVHILSIERKFAQALERRRLLDDAALYRAAQGGPLPGTARHLILHALYDFDGVQRELLADVARRASVTMVFPEIDEESSAQHLLNNNRDWASAQGFIEHRFVATVTEVPEPRVIACAGARTEAREIAREILAACADERVRFGDCAVLLSRASAQQPLFVEEFRRARVPVAGSERVEVVDTIGGRMLLAAVRILGGDPEDADPVAVVGRVSEREAPSDLSAAYAASLARRAMCHGVDPERWSARLSSLARSFEAKAAAIKGSGAEEDPPDEDQPEERRPADLREMAARAEILAGLASRQLKWMAQTAARHRSASAPTGWRALAADLEKLVARLGIEGEPGAAAIGCARQLGHFSRFGLTFRLDLALDTFAELIGAATVRSQDEPVPEVDEEDGRVDGLSAESPVHSRRAGEGVLLVDINRARGLSVPRVWVAGLAQDLFASPSRPDPILGDAVRWKIAELTGLPIRTSMRRAEEADVQFALAEAAGRDALTLSWPRLEDVSGQMRFPADPLARRIEELAGEPPPPDDPSTSKAVTAVPAEPPQPTPGGERGRLLDEHEYDLAACLDANPRLCGHLEDDVALRRCMTTQRERWQERRLTRYDGITGVDERFPERFSPSSLERLARCPFRFLLHDRLGLRPGPEDAAAVAPDLLEIGSLAHDVLQAQFEKLIDCAPGDLPESARMIEGLGPSVDEALEKLVRRGAGGSRSVWRTVASRMRGELALVMLRELDRLKEERLRVESVERTLEGEIVAGGATIPLRGRADRIDRDAEGRLSVTDYKYSKGGRYKRSCVFDGGRTLQLPVYARLLAGERGSAGEVRFVFLRDDAERADSVTDLSETREWDDRLESLVSRLLETARAGAYFQVIEDGCRYCEFTDLCGPRKERLSELKGEAPQKLSHEALRKEFP